MKNFHVFLSKISATLFLCLTITGVFNCDVDIAPQVVTATGTISGEDGAYTPVSPVNISMIHIPDSITTRLIESGNGMQNQQSVQLNITRSGIPLTDEYWFLNISRVESRPSYEDGPPAESSGDFGWVRNHRGDLAVLGLRPDLLNSPMGDTLNFDATTGLRLTGTSYLVRIEADDGIIPFSDPAAVTDMSRVTAGLSTAIATTVTTTVNSNALLTLGGTDGAGDFRLYFVPHILHSTLSGGQRNVKGVTFIFRFTANVTFGINLAEFQVYIPVSILLEPAPSFGGGEVFSAALDPFSFINAVTPDDNLARITVIATGLFDQLIADQVRTAVVSGISSMTAAQLATLDLVANGLAGLINSFREDANAPIPDDWDVIVMPEQRPLDGNTIPNLVSPAPGGVAVRMVILE